VPPRRTPVTGDAPAIFPAVAKALFHARAALGVLPLTALGFACSGAAPLATPAERPELAHIRVEAGDIEDRTYLLLGSVEWPAPGRGNARQRCTPDRLRARAVEIYGGGVDGIVHYASWTEGGQSVCSGTAVQFIEEP
jgi:hypothetical protein